MNGIMTINFLLEGLVYALVLALIIILSQFYSPRLWLNGYPPAIREVVPKRTKAELRAKLLVGIPFMAIMVGYPILSTWILKNEIGNAYNYWIGFFNVFVILNIFLTY